MWRSLLLAISLGLARSVWAHPRDTIQRIDQRLRALATGKIEGHEAVQGRSHLEHVRYASGHELLHIAPLGSADKRRNPRGVNERAVHLTARHLRIPLRTMPPIVEATTTVYGRGQVAPWIRGLRKPAGSYSEPGLWNHLMTLAEKAPEQIDWESIHSVLILDYITDQDDHLTENAFFREVRGKLAAVSLDNEMSFGWHNGRSRLTSFLEMLVHGSRSSAARKLSATLQRNLRSIDIDAWKADLRSAGIPSHEVEAAARRLSRVQTLGLNALSARLAPGVGTP